MEREKSTSRRSFLQRILISWLLLVGLPGIYAVIQYLIPPKRRERLLESILVAKTQDIPDGGVKRVKFNKRPVYIFKTPGGQVKALSGVCTHLGCVVEFNAEKRNFVCNCHGSVFTLEGKNVSGPAPRPLESFRVELKGDDITISIIKS